MRISATGAPFSTARIGSTRPLPTLTLMELAASCWITLAFDWAKTRSILISAARKKPFLMPMWIGHRLVEPDDTPPAIMVSAAQAGVTDETTKWVRKVIARLNQICAGLLRGGATNSSPPPCGEGVGVGFVRGGTALPQPPDLPPWPSLIRGKREEDAPRHAITHLHDAPRQLATDRTLQSRRRWCATRPHGDRCIRARRRAPRRDGVRR